MNRNLVRSIYMYGRFCIKDFLKAEWKVSDTGSAHWASSFYPNPLPLDNWSNTMGKYIKIRVCMAVLPNRNNKFCQLHCIKNIKKPAQIKKEYTDYHCLTLKWNISIVELSYFIASPPWIILVIHFKIYIIFLDSWCRFSITSTPTTIFSSSTAPSKTSKYSTLSNWNNFDICTVKPVLRGHIWDKEKVVC